MANTLKRAARGRVVLLSPVYTRKQRLYLMQGYKVAENGYQTTKKLTKGYQMAKESLEELPDG